ncbi:hypothetical protein HDV63DRAFT_394137 [Trichoderma sp. SZMC 28014]
MRAMQAQPRTISCSSAPLWRCHALPAGLELFEFGELGRIAVVTRSGSNGEAVAAAKTGCLAQQVGVAKRRELRLTQAWSCNPLAISDSIRICCRSVTMTDTWCKGQDRFAFGRRKVSRLTAKPIQLRLLVKWTRHKSLKRGSVMRGADETIADCTGSAIQSAKQRRSAMSSFCACITRRGPLQKANGGGAKLNNCWERLLVWAEHEDRKL